MLIRIVCVGTLKEKYLIDACNEYVKRICKYTKIEIIELKEVLANNIDTILKEEGKEIAKNLKGYTIKMAIKGEMLDSIELAKKIENITINNHPDITFIIGGSYGIDDSIKCNFELSFSKMTFPHQLSRVMLLEQIYRSYSILNHSKYHK